jgi:propanediol dehydratase small subunit
VHDQDSIRSIVLKEIERYIPQRVHDRHLLTMPEAMRRYRCRREQILALIQSGEVKAVYRAKGKNGKPQYLVQVESADRHPQLGGIVQ